LSSRLTAVFVAVFAILAAGVWYFNVLQPQPATKTPVGQTLVFDLKAEEIARLDIVDAGKTATVERTDGGWRLVEPAAQETDARRIDNAVTAIAKLTATRKLEDATDLNSYGLAAPTGKLTLTMKDGASHELLLGAKTPDNSAQYVKRADSPAIFVAPTFAISDLLRWPVDPPKPRPTPPPLPPPGTPAPKAP
jgi:hypothetical protein